MNVAVVTSVSAKITAVASITAVNRMEYCLRHGYTFVADNRPYERAVADMSSFCYLLDRFDLVWLLDADAIVTDMRQPIHELPCLGPHVTVCREQIVPWNWINCGSTVWRNTPQARQLLHSIELEQPVWAAAPCGWQTWLAVFAQDRPDVVTVADHRAFNSTEWTHPGGGELAPGCNWEPGDFVYHPCGVYPSGDRFEYLSRRLQQVIR